MSNHRVGMILFIGIVLGNLMKKSLAEEDSEEAEKTESKLRIAALDTNRENL